MNLPHQSRDCHDNNNSIPVSTDTRVSREVEKDRHLLGGGKLHSEEIKAHRA